MIAKPARGIMRGDLAITGFSELMQLLAMGLKRGRLTVSSGEMAASIYLVDGAVAHATVSTRRERLGDLLVARNLLTRAQVERSIMGARASGQRIGEYLVSSGVLTAAVIDHAVRQQVESAVFACCALESGIFTFDPSAVPDHDEVAGCARPMQTEGLLLEGARRVDEWRIIAQHVPRMDVIFAADEERVRTSSTPVTEQHRFVLGLIDGRRDVQAVIAASGFDEFAVAHALHALASAGFVRAVDRTRARAPLADDVVEDHRHLGRTFARGRMHREAEREYRQVVQARPQDRAALAALGVLALRDGRVSDAIRWLEEAVGQQAGHAAGAGARSSVPSGSAEAAPGPLALYVLALAYERDGRLDAASRVLGQIEGNGRSWLIPFARGRVALRLGAYADALRWLESLDGQQGVMPIGWWHACALAYALTGDGARAVATAKAGLAVHSKSPRLCALLAACADRRGAYDEARIWAERGLRDQADYGPCLKNLADALYGLRDFANARAAYERVVARASTESADAWFKLGNVAIRLSDSVQARRAWKEALRIEPGHQTARSNLDVMGAREHSVVRTPMRPPVVEMAPTPASDVVVRVGAEAVVVDPEGDVRADAIRFDVY